MIVQRSNASGIREYGVPPAIQSCLRHEDVLFFDALDPPVELAGNCQWSLRDLLRTSLSFFFMNLESQASSDKGICLSVWDTFGLRLRATSPTARTLLRRVHIAQDDITVACVTCEQQWDFY